MSGTLSDRRVRWLAVTTDPEGEAFGRRLGRHRAALRERGVDLEPVSWDPTAPRWRSLLEQMAEADGVWWHRLPLPPWRWGPWRRRGRRIVFDLDSGRGCVGGTPGWRGWLKTRRFTGTLRRCDAVVAASHGLGRWVAPLGTPVHVIANAMDLPPVARPSVAQEPLRLLWIGTNEHRPLLETIRPALEQIGREQPGLVLRMVCDEPTSFGPLKVETLDHTPQNIERSIRQCHIGLWPFDLTQPGPELAPQPLLRFMAHGMAWIGSEGGEVRRICEDGFRMRGLTARTPPQWIGALSRLIRDRDMIRRMGLEGRAYMEREHAPQSVAHRLGRLLRLEGSGEG